MHFFKGQLIDRIDGIEKALKQIDSQQYILNINGIYDENLREILLDYGFEFYAAELTLGRDYEKDDFWSSFDAIKQDLIKYIYNWVYIRYYNYCRFKPQKYRRALEALKETGIFDVISGILVGKPMDEAYEQEYQQILTNVIDDPRLLVAYNINIGHAQPRCVIPFGVEATVDIENQVISFANIL